MILDGRSRTELYSEQVMEQFKWFSGEGSSESLHTFQRICLLGKALQVLRIFRAKNEATRLILENMAYGLVLPV